MSTRVTPSRRRSPLALSRVRAGRAARREVRSKEQQLTQALAGDFGPGVLADVMAARYRSVSQHGPAA